MKGIREKRTALVGVISDTHGLLRPQAVEVLRGSSLILHAGDVGRPEVLDELRRIAPVVAVRGNVDRGSWTANLAEREWVEVEGCLLYLLHHIEQSDIDPAAAGVAAVISGHTHLPHIQRKDGVLYPNPGSAGPKRRDLPVCVGRLKIADGCLEGEIIELRT